MPFAVNVPRLFNPISIPTPEVPNGLQVGALFGKLAAENDPQRQFLSSLFDRIQQDNQNKVERQLFENATGQTLPQGNPVGNFLFGQPAPSPETINAVARYKAAEETPLANAIQSANLAEILQRMNLRSNPKLTADDKSAIAGYRKFKPLIEEVTSIIDKGIFQTKNPSERLYKQTLAENPKSVIARILTPDGSDLEKLASARSEVLKYVFSEGGKALTKEEKDIVTAGFTFTGKSDNQIKTDYRRAIDVLKEKSDLALLQPGASEQVREDGQIMEDANGNRAIVYPDGTIEEL